MLRNPRLRDVPFAVCGSTEERHGIVLAANYPAKRQGVKTAMANWEARSVCKGLKTVPPRYDDYLQFSGFVREIYADYTNEIESFGLDECWVSLTGNVSNYSQGEKLVNEIRGRIKNELGLYISVGLSFNKIFAKLGSDMRKPDNYTIITPDNYKELVWSLPAGDLLYVGRKTQIKLASQYIKTIGDIANCDPERLHRMLGKVGYILYAFANVSTTVI